MRHNKDAIISVKLSVVRLCCFHVEKRVTVHKNCPYFKITPTRIQNQYYEQLLLEYMKTHQTHARTGGPGLVLMSV